MIQVKRVYEKPSRKDGIRILVDRLWPRGLTKERAAVNLWLKEVAPSTALRKWFGHDPARWREFQTRYRKELRQNKDPLELLEMKSNGHTVTLVYGARDEEHKRGAGAEEDSRRSPVMTLAPCSYLDRKRPLMQARRSARCYEPSPKESRNDICIR